MTEPHDNLPYLLAWANDYGFEHIFVEQIKNLASSNDILIALSGSGNSINVLKTVNWANEQGMTTWGVTGFSGGALREIAKKALHVPADDMGIVESAHLLLFHWIINDLAAVIAEEDSCVSSRVEDRPSPVLAPVKS